MKNGKLILSTAALIVTFASAFAFKSHARKGQGTLFTKANGTGRIDCISQNASANDCPVPANQTLFTLGGSAAARPYQAVGQ